MKLIAGLFILIGLLADNMDLIVFPLLFLIIGGLLEK